jgi:hypothetical protein
MDEGGADIVAIATPHDLFAFDRAVMFLERQDVGHDLTGVSAVGQAVDHRNGGVFGHLQQGLFLKRADHDHINIARQNTRRISNGFAMAQSATYNFDVYQPRNPKTSAYYKCVENHFEELERAWDDMYASRYGFWRTYVMTVIFKYLDCGDLHMGFARVRCEECGHEYLLAFSCKRRQFCPSCHQKRVVEYSEWLLTNVLKDVPHRQWVFSIPKRLRIYFLYDRKLLAKLSICGWKVLSAYLKSAVPYDGAVPGASIAVQTYGDFQNFNPHLHAIVSDGCFIDDDSFRMAPAFMLENLEEAFQYEVLKILKKKREK